MESEKLKRAPAREGGLNHGWTPINTDKNAQNLIKAAKGRLTG